MAWDNPIRDLAGTRARWRRLHDAVAWELVPGGAESAVPALAIVRHGQAAYVAEIGSQSWQFQDRSRPFGYRVVVQAADTHREIAVLSWRFHWLSVFSSATLTIRSSGRTFRWKRERSPLAVWAFYTGDGHPLLTFRDDGSLDSGAEVEVHAAARQHPELPLLLTLGWYVVETHSLVFPPPIPS